MKRVLRAAVLAVVAFGFGTAIPAMVHCVEYSSGGDCFGQCDFYSTETGEYQGYILYNC